MLPPPSPPSLLMKHLDAHVAGPRATTSRSLSRFIAYLIWVCNRGWKEWPEWPIRLRKFDYMSGEYHVCKLIVSTDAGQIGAMNAKIITKPVNSPSKLRPDARDSRKLLDRHRVNQLGRRDGHLLCWQQQFQATYGQCGAKETGHRLHTYSRTCW